MDIDIQRFKKDRNYRLSMWGTHDADNIIQFIRTHIPRPPGMQDVLLSDYIQTLPVGQHRRLLIDKIGNDKKRKDAQIRYRMDQKGMTKTDAIADMIRQLPTKQQKDLFVNSIKQDKMNLYAKIKRGMDQRNIQATLAGIFQQFKQKGKSEQSAIQDIVSTFPIEDVMKCIPRFPPAHISDASSKLLKRMMNEKYPIVKMLRIIPLLKDNYRIYEEVSLYVTDLITKNLENIYDKDENGMTILHILVSGYDELHSGLLELVCIMLPPGMKVAFINEQDTDGDTALMKLAQKMHMEIDVPSDRTLTKYKNMIKMALILLDNDARVDIYNGAGQKIINVLVMGGDEDVLRIALRQISNVNEADNQGTTLIALAVRRLFEHERMHSSQDVINKSKDVVKLLLDNGAEPDKECIRLLSMMKDPALLKTVLRQRGQQSIVQNRDVLNDAFILACCNMNVNMVYEFIKSGIDPSIANDKNITGLHCLVRNSVDDAPAIAIIDAMMSVMKHQDQRDNYISRPEGNEGNADALSIAYSMQKYNLYFHLCQYIRPSVELPSGIHPFRMLCEEYDIFSTKYPYQDGLETLEMMLKTLNKTQKKGFINSMAYDGGDTVLTRAVRDLISKDSIENRKTFVELIDFLLKNGGDPAVGGMNGDTPLIISCTCMLYLPETIKIRKRFINDRSINHTNIYGQSALSTCLLVAQHIKQSKRTQEVDESMQLLTIEDMIKKLITNGADVNVIPNDGMTPIMYLCQHNDKEYLELMITMIKQKYKGNDKISTFICTPGRNGDTALIIATMNGHIGIVELLLRTLPTSMTTRYVNHQNDAGETALLYACRERHINIIRHLIDYQADPSIASKNGETPLSVAKTINRQMVDMLEPRNPRNLRLLDMYRQANIYNTITMDAMLSDPQADKKFAFYVDDGNAYPCRVIKKEDDQHATITIMPDDIKLVVPLDKIMRWSLYTEYLEGTKTPNQHQSQMIRMINKYKTRYEQILGAIKNRVQQQQRRPAGQQLKKPHQMSQFFRVNRMDKYHHTPSREYIAREIIMDAVLKFCNANNPTHFWNRYEGMHRMQQKQKKIHEKINPIIQKLIFDLWFDSQDGTTFAIVDTMNHFRNHPQLRQNPAFDYGHSGFESFIEGLFSEERLTKEQHKILPRKASSTGDIFIWTRPVVSNIVPRVERIGQNNYIVYFPIIKSMLHISRGSDDYMCLMMREILETFCKLSVEYKHLVESLPIPTQKRVMVVRNLLKTIGSFDELFNRDSPSFIGNDDMDMTFLKMAIKPNVKVFIESKDKYTQWSIGGGSSDTLRRGSGSGGDQDS